MQKYKYVCGIKIQESRSGPVCPIVLFGRAIDMNMGSDKIQNKF